MNFHIVSAHFGGKPPWEHRIDSKHRFTYRYYNDNNTSSRVHAMHPRLKAKIPKMLEWQYVEADWYLWLDSSCKIHPGADILEGILNTSMGNPLCLFQHSQGKTILEEALCVKNNCNQGDKYFTKRYAGEPILEQVSHYYGDPNFEDKMLFQMSCFAYHKSASKLMLDWFIENCKWSIEDQISFPYVLQKSGLNYSLFEGTVTENNFFKWDWSSRENFLLN